MSEESEQGTPAPETDETADDAVTDEGEKAAEEGEQPPQADDESDGEEQPKKPNRLQKRFDELTRQRYQLEAENRRLKEQLESSPKEETKAPDRDDYDSYEDYLDARAEYLADQKVKSYREQEKKQELERKRQQQQEELLSNWELTKSKAREKYKDFDEVLNNDDAPLTETMAYAMMESDYGGEIGYYLGKHPEEAQRISQLSTARQAAELGKLELQVSTKPTKPKASKAPDPIETVNGSGSGDSRPSDDDDIETWMKKEKARQEQLRGG